MDKDLMRKTVEGLCDEVNAEDGAVLAIISDRKSGDYYAVGDMTLIRNGISSLLKDAATNTETRAIAYAIVNGICDAMYEGVDLDVFAKGGDDDEDCASCEKNMVCMNEAAVRYRLENGLSGVMGVLSDELN